MESVRAIRPSSTNMRAATEVIGLVMEAILKIVFRSTGRLASTSRQPTQVVCASPDREQARQMRVAAPAS